MDDVLGLNDYEARIRERAQQLWEEAGRPEGDDQHFWFTAQRAFAADHPDLAPQRADDPAAPPEEPDLPMGDNS